MAQNLEERGVIKSFLTSTRRLFQSLVPDHDGSFIVSFSESERVPYHPNTLFSQGRDSSRLSGLLNHNRYTISRANTYKQKKAARELIGKMYSQRNYKSENLLQESSRLTTFVAYTGSGKLAGTVTVGLDSGDGLFAEESYQEEVASLRKRNGKVCEFTCLAVAPEIRSRKVLAGLFHVAMLYASRLFDHSGVIFEVTPQHGQFYEKMLGMKNIASGQICKRVNTPSVLIHSGFSYIDEQILRAHGQLQRNQESHPVQTPSLYRHFFDKEKEDSIVSRLDGLLEKKKSCSPPAISSPLLSPN